MRKWREEAWTLTLFALNGIVATLCHFATLTVLIETFRVPSVGASNALASVVGITVSYCGNRLAVFRSRAPVMRSLGRFLALYASLAVFHGMALYMWSDVAQLPYGIGFLIATAIATLLSYFGNRFYVFRPSAPARADVVEAYCADSRH